MAKRTCSVDGCESKTKARGWCTKHYQRWQVHGSLDETAYSARRYMTDEERFWSYVSKADGCWEWTGSKNWAGYGRFWWDEGGGKRLHGAHRTAYQLVFGPIPGEMVLDHLCHNPGCVNPGHLRPVTHKENNEHRRGAQRNSATGVRGVSWSRAAEKWQVTVHHNGKGYYGGVFDTVEDANRAAIELRNTLFTHNDHDRVA